MIDMFCDILRNLSNPAVKSYTQLLLVAQSCYATQQTNELMLWYYTSHKPIMNNPRTAKVSETRDCRDWPTRLALGLKFEIIR